MLTIRRAHMSLLASSDFSTTLIITASLETRLILRHLNISTLLLLLDRRRCAENPEEGEKAPYVLVKGSAVSLCAIYGGF